MDARNHILSAIREARRNPAGSASKSDPSHPSRIEAVQGPPCRNADCTAKRIEAFKKECELVSGRVYVVEGGEEALHVLKDLFNKRGIKRILRDESPVLNQMGLNDLIDSLGIENLSSFHSSGDKNGLRADSFKCMAQAEMGITGVDYGLADTGTLVLLTGPEQDRTVSILPPIHVAVMNGGQILPSLDDLIDHLVEEFRCTGRPQGYLTLITGPSRTADIELNLVLGVHGPKELHVIILE